MNLKNKGLLRCAGGGGEIFAFVVAACVGIIICIPKVTNCYSEPCLLSPMFLKEGNALSSSSDAKDGPKVVNDACSNAKVAESVPKDVLMNDCLRGDASPEVGNVLMSSSDANVDPMVACDFCSNTSMAECVPKDALVGDCLLGDASAVEDVHDEPVDDSIDWGETHYRTCSISAGPTFAAGPTKQYQPEPHPSGEAQEKIGAKHILHRPQAKMSNRSCLAMVHACLIGTPVAILAQAILAQAITKTNLK